jgi:two-component system response regulator (stage 0 sporulation protein F)
MNNILIVDDDRTIRFLYKEELTYEGYNVITTHDCRNLLELIDNEKPDLVVLEALIDQYNGLDLLQKIRNTYYDLPVILCTAYSGYKNDPRSIAADYYVLKSSDLSELKQKIKMAIEAAIPFCGEIVSKKKSPQVDGLSKARHDTRAFIA